MPVPLLMLLRKKYFLINNFLRKTLVCVSIMMLSLDTNTVQAFFVMEGGV